MARPYMYGLHWPESWTKVQIELHCWKHWRELEGATLKDPVEEHLYEACDELFTKEQLVRHPWFEVQAHSWTYDDFAIWWGCAGSGKSHSAGLFALLDFITDPDKTFILLASTTKDMLARRSYSSVVQYLTYLKANRRFAVPFKFMPSKMAVVPASMSDEDFAILKHVILGVAVQDGTEAEARANLQGVHTTYVRAIFDELAAMKPAAMASRHNLAQCEHFKLLGLCNPESFNDEAGKFSIPVTGWASVGPDTPEWETPWGKVVRFDAFKSPGIENPTEFPFLPTQKSIDRILKENNGNADAPPVWTMLKAFPPPQGGEQTVFSESAVVQYKMQAPASFLSSYVTVAALDPAFTSDGDGCVYQVAKVGTTSEGVMSLVYGRTVQVDIKASDPRTVLQQIEDQVVELVAQDGVKPEHLAVDDSGTQNVADALSRRLRSPVCRFNYGSKPPDLPVSVVNETSASKKYKNVVTWLYYIVREYAERGQIRGLPTEAMRQMTLRRVSAKLGVQAIESKREHKKRLKGRSPDEGDAAAMCAGVARLVLGLAPGAAEWSPEGESAPDMWTGINEDFASRINNLRTSYSPESDTTLSENSVDGHYESEYSGGTL